MSIIQKILSIRLTGKVEVAPNRTLSHRAWLLSESGKSAEVRLHRGGKACHLLLKFKNSNALELQVGLPFVGEASLNIGGLLPRALVPEHSNVTGLRFDSGDLTLQLLDFDHIWTLGTDWWRALSLPITSWLFGQAEYFRYELDSNSYELKCKSGRVYAPDITIVAQGWVRPRLPFERVEFCAEIDCTGVTVVQDDGQTGALGLTFYKVSTLEEALEMFVEFVNRLETLIIEEEQRPKPTDRESGGETAQ